MTKKPVLIDDNVEDIRRVRREISAQFKTTDEFLAYFREVERASIRRQKRERLAKVSRKTKLPKAKRKAV